MKEQDLEAIKDIANKKTAIEYPLLSSHYVEYDVECIAWAIEYWKKTNKNKGKEKKNDK